MGYFVHQSSKTNATREVLRRAINTLNLSQVLEVIHSPSVKNVTNCHILVSLASWLPKIDDMTHSLETIKVSDSSDADQLVRVLKEKEKDIRRDICYTVIDFARDSFTTYDEWLEEMGKALIEASEYNDYILIDTLMHSGADLFYQVTYKEQKLAVWDVVMMSSVSIEVTTALDTLFPGLPQTVTSCSSLDTVRKFLRMWVYPPPIENCSSFIRNEISHHSMTIKMIHAIYANNVDKVQKILHENASSVDVNARAIDRVNGPTILWYVIEKKQSNMARLLVSHGARVDYTVNIQMLHLSTDNIVTLPVLYAAISDATVSVDMMKALLQQSSDEFSKSSQMRFKEILYRMLFNGKNLLEQALDSCVNENAFNVLLNAVGAKAIADRNSKGKTIRDIASSSLNKRKYVELIDQCVINIIQNTESFDRKILALFGYDITNLNMQEPPVDDFYSLYGKYQEWIKSLCKTIDKDDIVSFTNLLEYSGEGDFERLITWEGREGSSNPLPMLHRAVIFNRKEMVQAILKLRPPGYSIDSLLDHQRRTALHYAYAKSEFAEIRDILRSYGCSEKVKDRVSLTFSTIN